MRWLGRNLTPTGFGQKRLRKVFLVTVSVQRYRVAQVVPAADAKAQLGAGRVNIAPKGDYGGLADG
jgi:hypothetical protein